ncbi:MAG: chemotaxis protein CheD [Clostridia bacterium]|jgi:chemotaxis protein CheD|nr:chemotaxis protein CheD [Clostridia bacterium]
MEWIVGMGEYVVANGEEDVIRTFALASCVAVTVYSPLRRAAGMIHVVLPEPLNGRENRERPGYFAATGIPLLIGAVCTKFGCRKEELQIQMYGGASSGLTQDVFNIGSKNIRAVKNALLEMGLTVYKADLHGQDSRTLAMAVKTGTVEVTRQPIRID